MKKPPSLRLQFIDWLLRQRGRGMSRAVFAQGETVARFLAVLETVAQPGAAVLAAAADAVEKFNALRAERR